MNYKLRHLKSILSILIVFAVMIGLCGCMKTNAEEIKAEALAYLNNNYSDTFTAKLYTASDWAYEYDSITFTSEKFPGAIVEVRVYKNDDGAYHFKDNYYHCYMLDSAVSYGEELLTGEDAVIKVRFADTIWSDELADARSFTEWRAHGTARADFFVITGDALAADTQIGIVSKIANDKVCGYVTFISTEDDNLLQDITLDEILNQHNKFVASENKYFINRQFEIQTN